MIDPKTLQIESQQTYSLRNNKVTRYDLLFPYWKPANNHQVIFGIDPGDKNMGLTILPVMIYSPATCYEITFPSERLAISRAIQIRMVLSDIIFYAGHWTDFKMIVAVEGSSFGHPYRQTELAEARIVAAEWFLDTFTLKEPDFIFIPPLTVRKNVFGSAKIKAETQWPQLKGDAASSLAIALAGLALKSV